MIGLNLGASAKLAFIWMISPSVLLSSKPNLRFDLAFFLKIYIFEVKTFYLD